ncbi:UNVERIFIED_ORG: transcriptional regulator [Lacrimispora saccharolytica]|nr:transcriptional regulator Cro/CI family [Clostridium sp. CAG:149]
MTIQDAVNQRIRMLCRVKKISIYELAIRADIPLSTLRSILGGRSKNPGIETINKIVRGLGLEFREFWQSECFDEVDDEKDSGRR